MTTQGSPSDISRTAARLARHVEVALASVELSLAQFRVLSRLAEGTVGSSSLATENAVSPPSITNVVEGLVQRGLVQREHSDNDRRRVALKLTKQGETVLSEGELAVQTRLAGLASEVDDASFATDAMAGLASWRRALDAHRLARQAERALRTKVGSR